MSADHEPPLVSVVVPMLDEMGYIEACLEGFNQQTYPRERMEILVVDGGSVDGSRDYVDAHAAQHPWVRVIENPQRRAAAAFNRGIEAARGDVLCIFSSHGVPDPDYIAASVRALDETGAAGVGGRYLHVGLDPVSSAVGLAMVSPFGMASPHRYANKRTDVDTISHPAYRMSALRDTGPFDETLARNSDYELNHRMLRRGHRLVFDPDVVSVYRPRASLQGLARQFWWYGRWKARVLRRHPDSLKVRHLVPPAAALAASAAPALLHFRSGRRLVLVGVGTYGAMVLRAVRQADPTSHDADPVTLAAAFPVMHFSWGTGFLTSLVSDAMRR